VDTAFARGVNHLLAVARGSARIQMAWIACPITGRKRARSAGNDSRRRLWE